MKNAGLVKMTVVRLLHFCIGTYYTTGLFLILLKYIEVELVSY